MVRKPEPVNGTATAKTGPSSSPTTSMLGLKPNLLNNLLFKTLKLKTKQHELLIRVSILCIVYILALITRLFSVLRYESMIHEFDPYVNYRTTLYLIEKGFYDFWNWFDSESWYPLSRIIGGTLYPGLMVTATLIY